MYPPRSRSPRPRSPRARPLSPRAMSPRPMSPRSVSPRPGSSHSFDPTGRLQAAAKLANKDISRIVKKAVKIHKPEEVSREPVPQAEPFKKYLRRKVEVPFTRKVKVPVTTEKLVPVKEQQVVRTKKFVEAPGFKTVDEVYTVVKEIPVEREREVWVKKIIKETVMEPHEEKRTRKKQIPTTVMKEVEVEQVVDVIVNKPVKITGYRVDEVQDTKLVEVDEEVEYELVPKYKNHRVVGHRELGRAPREGRRGHLARQLGTTTYMREEVDDYDDDSDPDDVEVVPRQPLFSRIGFTLRQQRRIGDVGARPPVVCAVEAGGPAHKAGVQIGDILIAVQNVPVAGIPQFREVVSRTEGTIDVLMERNGARRTHTIKRKARYQQMRKDSGSRMSMASSRRSSLGGRLSPRAQSPRPYSPRAQSPRGNRRIGFY